MSDNENELVVLMTERFERRLSEETGALRIEMATEFGKTRVEMAQGFGSLRAELAQGLGALRAEMIDRNTTLLRWGLMFGVTQTAAIAGIVSLLR